MRQRVRENEEAQHPLPAFHRFSVPPPPPHKKLEAKADLRHGQTSLVSSEKRYPRIVRHPEDPRYSLRFSHQRLRKQKV